MVRGRPLLAVMVILVAWLIVTLPAQLTAASGMAAMAQAMAAYTSAHANLMTSLLAREAVTLLSRHLLACVDQGDNLHARQAVLLGAHLAGQALDNAPAPLLRALACPLGALFQVSYAESVALLLPHLLRSQLADYADQLAQLCAIAAPHVDGSTAARAEALVVAMQQLAKTTGLASSLESVGVAPPDLDRLADEAMLQWRLVGTGDCPLTRDQAHALYAAAL
jgi:alcohol dehydrogenase